MRQASLNFKLLISTILIIAFSINGYGKGLPKNLDSWNKNPDPFLYFTQNKGQWNEKVKFSARFNAATLYLENQGLTYDLYDPEQINLLHESKHTGIPLPAGTRFRGHAFNINFKGSNLLKEGAIEGSCEASFKNNYYIDNDPANWASNVSSFAEITYRELYDGVDLRFYSKDGNMKYDFIVSPQASTSSIQLEYEGVDKLEIKNGEVHAHTSINTVIDQKPYAYQYINGQETPVPCFFKLDESGKSINFHFPEAYNKDEVLIIDPAIVFSTFSGSSADNWGFTATYDPDGHLYAAGTVFSSGYPTTSGAYDSSFSGGSGIQPTDIGITKFAPNGQSLIYSTYIGGSAGNDLPHSLIVNSSNQLVLFGTSGASNFPTTSGSFDGTYNGGDFTSVSNIEFNFGSDIIVSIFSEDGSDLVASTFVGGSENDGLNIANGLRYNYADEARGEVFLDGNDNVLVATTTESSNFPTVGAFQSAYAGGAQDACIFKLSSDLSNLQFSTFLGGSGADAAYSIKIDSDGNLFACGGTRSSNFPVGSSAVSSSLSGNTDGFLVKLNSTASNLLGGTYLGTSNYDQSFFLDLNDEDEVFTVGQTSGNYTVTPGVYNNPNSGQFLHKLSNDLSTTLFSTVFGNGNGSPNISPTAFLIDICNRIYVSGWGGETNFEAPGSTTSNLPVTSDAYQGSTDGSDFYFIIFEEDAVALEYATFFGGAGISSEHVDGGTSRFDKTGIVYQAVCAGCGGTNDFPTTPSAYSQTNNSENCNLGAIKFDFQIPAVFADVLADPVETGCTPLDVTFENNSINAVEYFWDFGFNGETSTLETPTFTYTETGVFDVMLIASDPLSCNVADTAFTTITVLDPSTVTADFSSTEICETFAVDVEAPNDPTLSFAWSFQGGGTASGPSASYVFPGPGVYDITLTVSSNVPGCPATDQVTQSVELLESVVADIGGGPNPGCVPNNFSFANNSINGVTYLWDFGYQGQTSTDVNPTFIYPETGVFPVSLTAFNPETCNLQDQATWNVVVLDTIIEASFDYTLPGPCDEQSVQFTTNLNPYLDLTWDFGDGTSGTAENPLHLYDEPGDYTVSLIANSQCAPADTFTTIITLIPPPIVDGELLTFPENGCTPVTVNLEGTGNAPLYQWDWGDGTSSEGLIGNHEYTEPGIYEILFIAIDASSCNYADTSTTSVEVYAYAEALFEATSLTVEVNQGTAFTNLSSNADTYFWDFGDGSTSTEFEPIYTFSTEGVYEVCLTASNPQDCNDIYCQQLTVVPPIFIGVPNAFSPNGDGNNDIVYVEGRDGIESMEYKIFNRWGELVFETTDPQQGWDGTYKGEDQEMDAYAFYVNATLISTRTIKLQGNITLLR